MHLLLEKGYHVFRPSHFSKCSHLLRLIWAERDSGLKTFTAVTNFAAACRQMCKLGWSLNSITHNKQRQPHWRRTVAERLILPKGGLLQPAQTHVFVQHHRTSLHVQRKWEESQILDKNKKKELNYASNRKQRKGDTHIKIYGRGGGGTPKLQRQFRRPQMVNNNTTVSRYTPMSAQNGGHLATVTITTICTSHNNAGGTFLLHSFQTWRTINPWIPG